MWRTFGPVATTVAQLSRLPTDAVAGIRMPPLDCRSPSASSDDQNPIVQELDRDHQLVTRLHVRRTTMTPTTTPTVIATWSMRTAPYSST